MKIKERYTAILTGIVDDAVSKFEINSESHVKVITTIAVGVGVTAVAGVAVAAVVGGLILFHERGAVSAFFHGQQIRPKPLNSGHWTTSFELESGKLKGGGERVIGRVRKGGCEPYLRGEVWPFILGLYQPNSTAEQREAERQKRRLRFEVLVCRCKEIILKMKMESYVSKEEVISIEPLKGTVEGTDQPDESSLPDKICESNFLTGELSSSETSTSNPNGSDQTESLSSYNLDVDGTLMKSPGKNETEDRKFFVSFASWRRIMRLDAVRMNAEWVPYSNQPFCSEEEADTAAREVGLIEDCHLEPSRKHHAARLVTILEAYAVHDPEIGYCQGMSDLLSPFVALIPDNSEAFWCFVNFMKKARQNFRLDEVGIRKQLERIREILRLTDGELYSHLEKVDAADCIFAYRMVVVLMRRELSFEQTLSLWEVLWADEAYAAAMDSTAAAASAVGGKIVKKVNDRLEASCELLLFVIAALIRKHRKEVLACEGVDEVLRLCNSWSGRINVWPLLDEARILIGRIN